MPAASWSSAITFTPRTAPPVPAQTATEHVTFANTARTAQGYGRPKNAVIFTGAFRSNNSGALATGRYRG